MRLATAELSAPQQGTAELMQGAARLFCALGHAVLREVPLPNGGRADLVALSADDRLTIVEVKSGVTDFRRDRKWTGYLAFCDGLVFAVPVGFPPSIIPESMGVAVVDRDGGELLRAPALLPLAAARRKAMIGKFARLAAARLEAVLDHARPASPGVA